MRHLLANRNGKARKSMELDNILKLIDAVSQSSLSSFSLDDGNIKLTFEANRNEGNTFNINTDAVNAQIAGNASVRNSSVEPANIENISNQDDVVAGNVVKSPLVGIFYSAGAPDEEPMVKVGDTVKKGQVLGIVEAMKLMNEIESDFDGVVKKILVENEQMVEFGQPMFVIE